MARKPIIVVLDDILAPVLAEILRAEANDVDVEIAEFRLDSEAAQFVAQNSSAIVGYVQDINRPDVTGRTASAGVSFYHQVIDQFTPRAKVVFHSGSMGHYLKSDLLPEVAGDRLRFYAKPVGSETWRNILPWLLTPPVHKEGEKVTESLRLVIPPWSDVCRYLADHPEFLHRIDSRRFEELIAEIFRSHGWEVDFTAATRDGGFDLIAVRRSFPTSIRSLVEVKRWAPDRAVGVEVIRSLYGVRVRNPTSQLVLATSSYVSKDAKREFSRVIPWEVDLIERDIILDWCRDYGAIGIAGALEDGSEYSFKK